MTKHTPLACDVNLCPEGVDGCAFEMGSLFDAFCGLHDQRDARGLR